MIRIYQDGELRDSELLKRNAPKFDVAGGPAALEGCVFDIDGVSRRCRGAELLRVVAE